MPLKSGKRRHCSRIPQGKVPRAIFERRFGVEVLYQDALDYLLPTAYAEAVKKQAFIPSIALKSILSKWRKGRI